MREISKLEEHILDCTAAVVVATPILSTFETQIAGLSIETSIYSRTTAAIVLYLGVGKLLSKGRKTWRDKLNVNKESSELKKDLVDRGFLGLWNLIYQPIQYSLTSLAADDFDVEKIITATSIAVAYGLIAGGPWGYVTDLFKEFRGIEETNRWMPSFIKNKSPNFKKKLVGAMIVASLTLTAINYYLSSHKHDNLKQGQNIQNYTLPYK